VTARSLTLGAALCVALSAGPARAADDPREVQGRAMFAKGEYGKALDLYATLFAETNDPLFLRNIGRCYQKLRIPDKAIEAFHEYVRRSPKLKASEQAEIDGFIKEMEELQRTEREKAAVTPPPPPPPDLRAREPAPPPGAAPAAAVVSEGPPPEEKPIYTRWWFWTAVVATAAVITAVALSSSSTSVGNCMGLSNCARVKN
jgi:tetratricopeptide (TPR) repeat protein